MSRQQCLSLPIQKSNSFSINLALNPDRAAELQRCIGPIFNISTLYNSYIGFLKPFTSRSEVRHAICNIIYQEIVNIDLDIPYLDHEKPFNDIENKSLLIALLDNTIVPSFYHGRALPLDGMRGPFFWFWFWFSKLFSGLFDFLSGLLLFLIYITLSFTKTLLNVTVKN